MIRALAEVLAARIDEDLAGARARQGAADEVGVGMDVELRAIEHALVALDRMPPPLTFSLNASPELLISGRLEPVLRGVDLTRVALEITEHAAVADCDALSSALAPFRARGALLSIDDAGAGLRQHAPHSEPET